MIEEGDFNKQIDESGARILSILQEDARTSNSEIARGIGLTPSAVLERIRKLKASKLLVGLRGIVDRRRLGFPVTAFVEVRTDAPMKGAEIGAQLAALDQVLEVHDVAGDACFLVKVIARDLDDLHAQVNKSIGGVPQVRATSTTIVLKTLKESLSIPIEQKAAAAPRY